MLWAALERDEAKPKPPRFALSPRRAAKKHSAKSWPLDHQHLHFDLAHVLNCAVTDALKPISAGSLSIHHAGLWECDLESGRLVWSGGVYDMFGLERGQEVTRERALSLYSPESAEILERLRSDAIRMRHGFTVDVEIYPELVDERRWVRIIAAPVLEGNHVRRLHGLKLAV